MNPYFAVHDLCPTIGKRNSAVSERFDFGAKQFDASLVSFVDYIVVPRLAIYCDNLNNIRHYFLLS
jgi:hypothetical protein